jgi:hypothetical protein
MRSARNGQVPAGLSRAAVRFADWRRTRVPGTRIPIPKSLWASAVKLARHFGVSRTATVLRLNYQDLRKRVGAASPWAAVVVKHRRRTRRRASAASRSRRTPAPSSLPAFVEWPTPTLTTAGECVIELEHATGSRMRMHLKGCHAPDLVALSGSFWNSRR